MAPIYSAEVGVTPQIIDDAILVELKKSLSEVDLRVKLGTIYATGKEVKEPLSIQHLISLLEPWQSWTFEEQVDLHEWTQPLNRIDACLSYYIQKYPALLLIGPVKRTRSKNSSSISDQPIDRPANSLDDVYTVPAEVLQNLTIILHFLAGLMANSSNKAVFNSVEELVDLLAAADDTIATEALRVLCNLAAPPPLHKQQAPEIQQHSSALHSSRTDSHKRLIAMARGWGTRGSGLGLYTCATADDSEFGQGALSQDAGELHFAFYKESLEKDETEAVDSSDSRVVEITLLKKDIIDDSAMTTEAVKGCDESDESSSSKQKRRRVAPVAFGEQAIRSTADLFFECLQQGGGREEIPKDKLFMLLADIRLARSFYCRSTRIAALERRLLAITAILYSHPSQEVMSGYFQAQPELCVELIDLLRTTVSSASISAASSKASRQGKSASKNDAIAALSNPSSIPYDLRELALQSLTALVGRRDGTTGALTGVARHSNVLSELGVGKGQYLGLLPTLIRFSLASLASLVSADDVVAPTVALPDQSQQDAFAFDIGLAFVQATAPPPLPRNEQLLKALEFIDSVLTLTSAVVSTQSGTAALTECGLIPALLTTVSVDHEEIFEKSNLGASMPADMGRIKALLRFVTAQAVQIIEGAIVTQSNALNAFHDLNGVEVLTGRLSKEISEITKGWPDDDAMETDENATGAQKKSSIAPLRCSQRVILFSIVTCLTVVFHQESTSSSTTAPSGAAELRKPGLTDALIKILDNMDTFGGHLGSLIATLLADVMNSDPHVVRHVHSSGLAKSFLAFFPQNADDDPLLPAVPELIMALPNVLSALALTEHGSQVIKEANPFPALLKIFYHPKYAMPRSKCLLNELTAIVGTGFDEIMRHIVSLKPLICSAIAGAMNEVAAMGEALAAKEKQSDAAWVVKKGRSTDLENERSCLMQYAINFGQLLEQILHNEEHTPPFVSAGGLDALLRLFPCLMPTGREFLSHVSCLSCPSVSTISHSSTEDAMTLAFRCIALRYDPFELVKTIINSVDVHLARLEELQVSVRRVMPSETKVDSASDATFVLEGLPCDPVFTLISDPSQPKETKSILSDYIRQVVIVQWITGFLAAAVKAASQRSQDMGTGWSQEEREWKKELSSTTFEELMERLSKFHQTSIFEACRVRTQHGFEEREKARRETVAKDLRYRLRIVCPEGAVVRDGIEIDSCANVGNMEMGEIAIAFDRCVNSSGVMRYRTSRGWVSEQTRGHGREPIAEVLSVWATSGDEFSDFDFITDKNRIESGLPDLRTTGANILSRLQSSYYELYSALSKVAMQGVRAVPVRTISFQQGTIGAHVATIVRIIKTGIRDGLNINGIGAKLRVKDDTTGIDESGLSMYLGCMLTQVRSCLFEEKRDRRTVNVPLLISISGVWGTGSGSDGEDGPASVFDAMRFVFQQALIDFELQAGRAIVIGKNSKLHARRRQSRATAASMPAAISVLKRCMSAPLVTSSPVSSVLSRVRIADLLQLLGEGDRQGSTAISNNDDTFLPERFFREVLCKFSSVLNGFWTDRRFVHAPPFVAHPVTTMVSEMMVALEDSSKKASPPRTARDGGLFQAFARGLLDNRVESATSSNSDQDFEPSEEAVNRLMEMGFSNDHAWVAIDSSRSNQLEIAMEYALSHPPPSAEEVERRRNAASARRRQREERNQAHQAAPDQNVEVSDGGHVTNREDNETSDGPENNRPAGEDTEDSNRADESIESVKTCLEGWKAEVAKVCCGVLASLKRVELIWVEKNTEQLSRLVDGDGDIETLTVVLTSFLLDVCQRHPDQKDHVAAVLFGALSSQVAEVEDGDHQTYEIVQGHDSSFSALCHAAVLFTRALPKTRIHVLRLSLIRKVVSCIDSATQRNVEEGAVSTPVWLPSALLLLDMMAQPMVAFADNEYSNASDSTSEELKQVEHEHETQADELAILARDLFLALNVEKKGIEKKESNSGSPVASSSESTKQASLNEKTENSNDSFFKDVPAYFPLLPLSMSTKCVDMCSRFLEGGCTSPGVIHAALLLLLRLLRSPATSSYCGKAGLAEKILALPNECRFTGHSGLVTLIFRRLLEDEATLQAAMETEIRQTMSKLSGKNQSSPTTNERNPSVPRKAFLQAITPLLCREPSCFLKAISVTVGFENTPGSASEGRVTLLTPSEKARGQKLIFDLTKSATVSSKTPPVRRSSLGKPKRSSSTPRSKTPVRSNKRSLTPKRAKKERAEAKERNEDEVKTPSMVITVHLINHLLKESEEFLPKSHREGSAKSDFGDGTSFLWAEDILGILAALVLAIPACATSIHKFRPGKSKTARSNFLSSIQNALKGCQIPPKTFVSFLLHYLLVQDRTGGHMWESSDEDPEKIEAKKQTALRRTRVSQATAKLLFALVARPGEGRRRVIAELTFALSGGLLGPANMNPQSKVSLGKSHPSDIHALQAWGELCIGLAAPRNSGSNLEGNGSLSFEVVRIMLEVGVAHALLVGVHKVPLSHPRANSAIAALILPFEVMCRPSVTDAVKALVEKEAAFQNARENSRSSKSSLEEGEKERSDSFADDHMLEDAFSVHHASRERDVAQSGIGEQLVDADGLRAARADELHQGFIVADGDPHMEEVGVEDGHMEIDDEMEDDEASDDEMSSSDDSGDSSDEESEDSDDSDDEENEEEEDDDDGQDSDSESIIEEEEASGTDEGEYGDYGDEMLVENPDLDVQDDAVVPGEADPAIEEGWTRIESNGFGGMVLGSRRGLGQNLGGSVSARTRGFFDAAEAMIGTLLRTGEIQSDALAEIEGSLGIRIMHHSRGTGRQASSLSAGIDGTGATNRRGGPTTRDRADIIGTLPQINQRNQPDIGYSTLGEGRRCIVSSMEYLYGGPSVNAGGRNYDLTARPLETNQDASPTLSQIDAPLFPGGPAAVAHARTQHTLHSLLCGVDLPPINALMSDLLPHGVRESRRGSGGARSQGDWTSSSLPGGGFLLSTSSGDIIRSNRSHGGVSLTMSAQPQSIAGPVGWTDDGLPFDGTVGDFSSAFDRALGLAMAAQAEHNGEERAPDSNGSPSNENSSRTDEDAVEQDDGMADADMAEAAENAPQASRDGDPAAPDSLSDGDGVASSLATGLRLSPPEGSRSNHSTGEDVEMNESPDVEGDERPSPDSGAANDNREEDAANVAAIDEAVSGQHQAEDDQIVASDSSSAPANGNGLVCPPDIDTDVFNALPLDMQREIVDQARAAADVASQLVEGSLLDLDVLASLPSEIREEAIAQEQRERRMRDQPPADPAGALEMDNASFLASLVPELREEILLTCDDGFLQSLPEDIRAEAQILRERASVSRRMYEEPVGGGAAVESNQEDPGQRNVQNRETSENGITNATRKKQRAHGKMRVESDRETLVYLSNERPPNLSPPVSKSDIESFFRFLYLLSPVRPQKLVYKLFLNMSCVPKLRRVITSVLLRLLHDDKEGARLAVDALQKDYNGNNDWRSLMDNHFRENFEFPPRFLLGTAPDLLEPDGMNSNISMMRRKQNYDTAASIAANLPMAALGSRHQNYLPPVVANRIVETLQNICKSSPRFCINLLVGGLDDEEENAENRVTGFDKLLDLLEKPRYTKSSANLEQLLILLESAVSPLSNLPKHGEDDADVSQKDLDAAASAGKEWVDVPRIIVSQERLQFLCSILRMETCRDTSFAKVNTIARRLCRVDANRGYVLAELASVARALGADAMRDLKALSIQMSNAVDVQTQALAGHSDDSEKALRSQHSAGRDVSRTARSASSSVAVSSSTSELKLLRVLQTLQALCGDTADDSSGRKDGNVYVNTELVQLFHAMELDDLWAELSSCLKIVQVLEGVKIEEDNDKSSEAQNGNDGDEDNGDGGQKLQNSVAGLLTRFLPSIESFFVANASASRQHEKTTKDEIEAGNEDEDNSMLVGGNRLVEFVSANKVLLNALVRNNSSLLDKGLRALVHVPKCRHLLDFDVKRHWFKSQVRRLRQHANRRHGTLRLQIDRRNVLIDAYHQLRLRNAEEMRGRLHITFRDEQGVDAGGLSREFFGILAKEIFNPNYALFTSTEDGSTFQPNPNSSINPDHLRYFHFVGRIVGKAVLDGYLLDAHFTRSLYKHMLGIKPTHHDMEAIDLDYYKNLKTILEYDLGDLGLDLTFSTEDHSFGRSRLIDLIPNGRNVAVTEQNKAKYVSLICQHRMTTAISSQINAYLEGFYELVSRDLISIFNPRELELLISGLPDIDVHDLKQNTDYVGWKSSDQQIQWFWNVLFSLSRNQKAAFLQFVTGSSKVPLAGFGELPGMRGVQKFSVHKASGSAGALMSAHTCFNSLDLPVYKSEEELKEKLLYAINEGAGTFSIA